MTRDKMRTSRVRRLEHTASRGRRIFLSICRYYAEIRRYVSNSMRPIRPPRTDQGCTSNMTKMRLHRLSSRLAGAATAVLAGVTVTSAADCPRRDALGRSRVLVVDAKTYSRVGLDSFSKTIPLVDHEVVLTFDDGPRPPSTQKVLAALARECVRATFFLVGRSSAKFPELVRRTGALAHTIAHHSWSHPIISKISFKQAKEDI